MLKPQKETKEQLLPSVLHWYVTEEQQQADTLHSFSSVWHVHTENTVIISVCPCTVSLQAFQSMTSGAAMLQSPGCHRSAAAVVVSHEQK